ncbi:MAG: hypothetical protein ABW092_17765 [Candidatus Thiodiazotropha sp.]
MNTPSKPESTSEAKSDNRWLDVVTAISIILVFFIIALLISLIPKSIITTQTLSVNANTESLQIALKGNRTYSWSLPAGRVALLTALNNNCDDINDHMVCDIRSISTFQVSGGPELKLTSMPGSKFMISLSPVDGREMNVKILGKDGELLMETDELLFYESRQDSPETRIPLIIESVIIGSMLYESTGDLGEENSTWQPMLRDGAYSIFANVGIDRDRFQLLEGEFSAGDVVFMRAKPTDDGQLDDASVWGHIAIEPAEKERQDSAPILNASFNTPFAELDVRRFGAPEGYTITAPFWLVVSKLPVWQSTWVIFISMILLYDVFCTATGKTRVWNKKLYQKLLSFRRAKRSS